MTTAAFRIHLSRLAIALTATAGTLTVQAQAQTQAQPPARIRTVRAGHAHAPAFRENILMAVSACQVVKHLPEVAPPLPSDAELGAVDIIRIEELFDGPNYAIYTTTATIWPDPTAGCTPRQIRRYSVAIELGCTSRIYGGTTLIGNLVDLTNPEPPDITLRTEAVRSTQCSRPRRPYDPTGLPRDDASGTPCIWMSAFMARSLAGAGLSVPADPDALDLCLYARQPAVPAGRGQHIVVLETRSGNRALAGNWLPATLGAAEASVQKLLLIADGTAIPSTRFEVAGARAFLEQPVKLGMTEKQ
ncbi:MAG: hypothetical protein IT355_08960 [Gemmatimonadaceae bacterium]|nr:hypothetical protein [Gemmatimonadaceae bacterium]